MILKLSDITVRHFMKALFDKDYEGIDNWDQLYTLYIDTSGLGEEGQLATYQAIYNLERRLFLISEFLTYHSKVYNLVKMPDPTKLNDMKEFGYRLIWKPENDNFIQQLKSIEAKEKRNHVEVKRLKKELAQMKEVQDSTTVSARNSFVLMLINLEKENYKIDEDKTDMEKLCLMIRQNG